MYNGTKQMCVGVRTQDGRGGEISQCDPLPLFLNTQTILHKVANNRPCRKEYHEAVQLLTERAGKIIVVPTGTPILYYWLQSELFLLSEKYFWYLHDPVVPSTSWYQQYLH